MRVPAILFLAAASLVAVLGVARDVADRSALYMDQDFAHYYLTALLVRQGEPVYQVPLAPLYDEHGFEPTLPIPYPTNPPALAALTVPLTFLAPQQAWAVWTLIQVLALIGAVVIGLRVLNVRATPLQAAALVLATLVMFPAVDHFRHGQVQSLILFLIVFGLFLIRSERTSHGAFLWGLATALKLFTFPLALVLWRYRGTKSVGWFAVGFGILHLAVLPKLGVAGFVDFGTLTLGRIAEAAMGFGANVSAFGTAVNTYSIVTGGSVLPGRSAWTLVGFLVLGAILFVDLRHRPKERALPESTAICLTASAYFSVTCWPHYFVLLTFPILALLAVGLESHRRRSWMLVVLLVYLMVGTTIGRVVDPNSGIELLTTWWGTVTVLLLLTLLMRAATVRRATVEADSNLTDYGIA